MKVDFMRFVDHVVGVPLCFLISILYSIQKVLGLNRSQSKPKKILFIELSEMGSTILAYSAMKKAKETFNAELFFLIFKENVESINLLDIIPKKNIITIRSKSLFTLGIDTLKALHKIRKNKIDTVIDLELFSRFTNILSFLSKAKNRVGFYRYHMEGLYRGNFITHRVQYNPHYHISQSFMALVYALLDNPKEKPMLKRHISMDEIDVAKVKSPKSAIKNIRSKIKELCPNYQNSQRIILLNPNASQLLPIRKWPLDRFKNLAKNLIKRKDVVLVITGTKAEGPDAKAICNYVKDPRCIDFTGKTSFRELIDLYNTADVLVTNDSGPAHFASLTNIHIIVLFGPETPKLYGPLSKKSDAVFADYACSPCVSAYNHRKTPCTNSRCLSAIDVSFVEGKVRAAIK